MMWFAENLKYSQANLTAVTGFLFLFFLFASFKRYKGITAIAGVRRVTFVTLNAIQYNTLRQVN